MTQHDPARYRYGENDSRPFFLNAQHYREASRICNLFAESLGLQPSHMPTASAENSVRRRPSTIRVDEENRRLPVDGHFAFYSDLLGFTMEVSRGGMDSLPDYYGGTFFAALQNPDVQAYLLSDSCIAIAPEDASSAFIRFVETVFSRWLSNGLVPQCAVGYGSFVERRPFAGKRPSNFFGTQIAGTALIDAVEVLKRRHPFGARILLSAAAELHWPTTLRSLALTDGQGNCEFLPKRPRAPLSF